MPKFFLFPRRKQRLQLIGALEKHALGHSVVQCAGQCLEICYAALAGRNDAHHARALNPLDCPKARIVQNVGRLARPRRLRTQARRDPHALTRRALHAGAQQLSQPLVIDSALRLFAEQQQVQIRRLNSRHARIERAQPDGQPCGLEGRQSQRPGQHPHRRAARGARRDFL